MSEILMPKLSSSMEEGTILSWLKSSGETVEIGEEILEIETDKSTVTYAAEEPGTLTTLVREGDTIAVGIPIAQIGSAAAIAGAGTPGADTSAAATPGVPTSPATTPAAATSAPVAPPPQHQEPKAPVSAPVERNGAGATATPLARRAAAVHGVPLEAVRGTGRLGRITRTDVLQHAGLDLSDEPPLPRIGSSSPKAAPAPAANIPVTPVTMLPGSERREASRLQQLIARRMIESKATIPHFQVQTEVAMDAAIALRAELKEIAGDGEPVPSLNDITIKAAALALREFPLANASYEDGGFVLHEQINVGMAVAVGDALIVPTVFDAAGKSLGQIARETRALAIKARDGQIAPAELEGGTFTVSNLGMFGMTAINPVVNPPQAAILGVGALRETLARAGGEIVDRTLMTLTLSCDHRILYGADAARFLARIRELLETPLKLAL